MRKIIMALMIMLAALQFSFAASSASAESLSFVWEYPAAEAAKLKGFRLYRDGLVVEKDGIAPTARTVTVPRQTDRRSHSYYLTAVSTEDGESKPSQTAIDAYVAAEITPVGSLIIKVVP